MPSTNVEIIKAVYAAFAVGDGPGAFSHMNPAIVWNEAENFPYADRNPYIGPGAIGEGVFFRLATEWDNFQAVPAELIDGGDTIVSLGRYTGTYKATGKAIDAQFVHVFRLADGKVTRFQQYADTAQAQQVIRA